MSALNPTQQRQRDLAMFRDPSLWCRWPFLPLIRPRPANEPELGVLFDARGCANVLGYSATVFLTNLLAVPSTVAELLALPKLVYDLPEEIAAAGWTVD
jgi:hypothetical protein